VNRSHILVWPALVSLALSMAACGNAEPSRGKAASASRSAEALSGDGQVCTQDVVGGVTAPADECVGGGSARVLARIGTTSTCSNVLDAVTAVLPDAQAFYQFPDAPSEIKDHYCIFQSGSQSGSAVATIVSTLCNDGDVALVTHDCSTAPFSAPDASRVFSARSAATLSTQAFATAPSDGIFDGTHGCDTCATVLKNRLFVNVPLSMTGDGTTQMTVRFYASDTPDQVIVPPPSAQSFTVSGVPAADTSDIRVYDPGVVPPPK